nr:hypothetical protein BaRGS_018565 [Batillaria attramentaria]
MEGATDITTEAYTDNRTEIPPEFLGLMDDENRSDVYLLHRIAEEYQNQTHWFSTETVVALVISYCVVIILGVLGNMLVVIVMCRRADLRTQRNFYILNLSICDVLMCSVCLPLSLVKYTLKRWVLGAAMCRIVAALSTVDVFVSTFTIVAIAADRYRSIVHANRSHSNPVNVLYRLIIIWCVSIGLAGPLFIFHELSTDVIYEKSVFHMCIEAWPSELFQRVYTTFVALIQYLTPTIVISVLHARICSFLRRRIHESPTSESQVRRNQREMKRHRKNLALLTAIAVSFSVTWLPLTILNITADWTHDHTLFGLFSEMWFYLAHAICLLLAMSSSAINPLLYGWLNHNFRNAFLEVLCWRRQQQQQQHESSALKGRGSVKRRDPNYDSFLGTPTPTSPK